MRKTLGSSLALCLTCVVALESAAPVAFQTAQAQDTANRAPANLSATQLDKLVAPIALYADPLLAQVLLAATFPDQIAEAAAYVRANGTGAIDDQAWDVSIKAVAHYPTILNMMDAKPEWTTELGQAYASQSTEIMDAVQRQRGRANAQGNLASTPQQQVVVQPGYIAIWPAQPSVIYVPVYDPEIIYVRHVAYWGRYPGAFAFGIGFPIGPWLIYDWDWPGRRVYYTGWMGGGWIGRSRPYMRFTNVYVNDRFRYTGGYERVHYTSPDRFANRHHEDRIDNWARGRDGRRGGAPERAGHEPGYGGRPTGERPTGNRGREGNGAPWGTHEARPQTRAPERYVPTSQPRMQPPAQPSGGYPGGGQGGMPAGHQDGGQGVSAGGHQGGGQGSAPAGHQGGGQGSAPAGHQGGGQSGGGHSGGQGTHAHSGHGRP